MELTQAQRAQIERDEVLIFPGLFAPAEIAVVRQEVARLSGIDAEEIVRKHTGGVTTIFRVQDTSTAHKLWAIPKDKMIEVLRHSPMPVAVTGKADTAVPFHCNVLHASGHYLSAEDRWPIYISCNTVANRPILGPNPQPDWMVSRNWHPLPVEDDHGVTRAA